METNSLRNNIISFLFRVGTVALVAIGLYKGNDLFGNKPEIGSTEENTIDDTELIIQSPHTPHVLNEQKSLSTNLR